VRIGGALGGDSPDEALKKGSIAIFSNSGNFTTTIATYLRMAGWGTTTLMSSGKDVFRSRSLEDLISSGSMIRTLPLEMEFVLHSCWILRTARPELFSNAR